MFPNLESCALMKKRSCSVLYCNVTYSLETIASGVSPMCAVFTLPLWLCHICIVQSSTISPFALWPGFAPSAVKGLVEAVLGLSWVRSDVCLNCGSSKLQDTLPVLSPEGLFLSV